MVTVRRDRALRTVNPGSRAEPREFADLNSRPTYFGEAAVSFCTISV
jgi:hypothetical protein